MPLYNHARYIGEAVDSILDQGALVKEVVVLDDGSSDGSVQAMERLARRDRRIRFERQANAGAHAAINTALGYCTGELVAILNSDDAFMPGRLAALAEILDEDSGIDIAASALAFMNGDGTQIANAWYEEARAFHASGAELGVSLVNGNFLMTTSNLVFRRTMLDSVGRFASFRYVHDLDWILRALALGRRIAITDRPLLRYRIHAQNTISEDHGRVRAEWAIAAAGYLTLLWDRPGAPPIDWAHAAALCDVLRKHALDRAVAPCMAYLRRGGSLSLDTAPLMEDAAFKDRVRGWV